MIFMNASDPLRRRLLLAAATAAVLAGCGRRPPKATRLPDDARVLALGDSLTFGQGAAPEQSWPAQLAARSGWTVVNAGLNGDTAAGAQARLGPLLAAERYDAVLVGIGVIGFPWLFETKPRPMSMDVEVVQQGASAPVRTLPRGEVRAAVESVTEAPAAGSPEQEAKQAEATAEPKASVVARADKAASKAEVKAQPKSEGKTEAKAEIKNAWPTDCTSWLRANCT